MNIGNKMSLELPKTQSTLRVSMIGNSKAPLIKNDKRVSPEGCDRIHHTRCLDRHI